MEGDTDNSGEFRSTLCLSSDVRRNMRISSQRLAGLIAGIFAIRAFDASMSAVSQLMLSVGEFSTRVMIAAPSLAGAAGAGLICWLYLREQQARWQHIVTIALLCVGILFGGFMIATPLITKIPTPGISGPMIVRGAVQIVFSAIAIGIVTLLLKKNKTAEPDATTNAADAARLS